MRTADQPQGTLIAPRAGWAPLDLAELWSYRELLFFLAWRDVKVRYKQTVLGAAWAVIQPALTMVVFSIFFGGLADVPSDGAPYPVFAFAALVPWTFFANGLTQAANSVVAEEGMIDKVYFPRVTVPLAAVLATLVDLAIAMVVLVAVMLAYGIVPGWQVVTLPAFVLLAAMAALGAGLWLAALNVQYRDVRYTLTFLVQLWLFASPVAYPTSLVPSPWDVVYGLNPMVGVIDGFRWALLGTTPAPGTMVALSIVVTTSALIGGLFYFRRMERTFADVI
ncbi:ABC transporter permease [Miltoncostaea oceani]|uniref:ABC transporter permease n=1 Tax=Miltoncostaea oceani TaxID=2843216 RepID=UPI001C3D9081|nr:ABC transporter permease [Miltoncostaea oceani]